MAWPLTTATNELKDFYASSKANNSPSPSLIKFNLELAKDLGSEWLKLDSDEGLSIFSGNTVPNGSRPISQAYSGHQFGGFSPLLGDGRAILLGEVVDKKAGIGIVFVVDGIAVFEACVQQVVILIAENLELILVE